MPTRPTRLFRQAWSTCPLLQLTSAVEGAGHPLTACPPSTPHTVELCSVGGGYSRPNTAVALPGPGGHGRRTCPAAALRNAKASCGEYVLLPCRGEYVLLPFCGEYATAAPWQSTKTYRATACTLRAGSVTGIGQTSPSQLVKSLYST